jgi:hypothetical protein
MIGYVLSVSHELENVIIPKVESKVAQVGNPEAVKEYVSPVMESTL